MARLVLNKLDKEKILSDIRPYVRAKYEESALGKERLEVIAEVQGICDTVRNKYLLHEEAIVLAKHNCLFSNDPDLSRHKYKFLVNKDYNETAGHIEPGVRGWGRGYFMAFDAFLILPSGNGKGSTHELIINEITGRLERLGIGARMWTLCDKIQCESEKIISQYEAILEDARNWEGLLEVRPEFEVMVMPSTISGIKADKEKKGLEIDPQVAMFSKETLSEKKEPKKARKKNAKTD